MNRQTRRLYQLTTGLGSDLSEILSRLTHLVWRRLQSAGYSLDPHLWPPLLRAFRRIFQSRLSHNPLCGKCLTDSQWRSGPPRAVFLLELRRPAEKFLGAVAAAIGRRLPAKDGRRAALTAVILETLNESFAINALCDECPANQTLADRRLWPQEAERPWREAEQEPMPLTF